ncbi:active breakpoint cluster region-related protein-like isoform X3 [Seriola lalandi dorsalis]|uniref:active breakpoint cluster region-related protein-like isoform X3 n=1 Tax=Seriola lalandi dorsalis TaxID=1841481 RepID=UPI000C6FCB59|nr:active breakpoint cluster region-related protein-like isoform X3 [Seriola lalandi dorsalis]XP_056224426.1 active breakpoint cluster region-related protein isoform X3 [Seriola aureovittata]
MDIYQEAVHYLETQHVPVVVEAETDVLEEDVFQEEAASCIFSPFQAESLDFPDTPTSCSPEEMLERRLVVLKGILESEEVYLRELEALLMPMKALRASAGTSKPVLSSRQVQTVFYQVPELRDMHQSFYSGLKAQLSTHCKTDPSSGEERQMSHTGFELIVGDLFLKMVNQIGLYGGFIENYEEAVEVVHKCTQSDPRFRTLAESMMTNNGADKARTKYTFEALLYKPLDRVTKTTLVLRDLLKTTPEEHADYAALQEALRLSRSFLSGVNESSQCKREVMLSHGMRRQLMRDGFVVDVSEGERSLRHLFLYTDLLLCTRFKHATRGKQDQYRFCWYLPLAGLKLRWVADHERSSDTHLRLHTIRAKMFILRQQLQQQVGVRGMNLGARSRKKLEQMELLLLTHSPVYRLELHSPSGKNHTLLFSSMYELEEWREAIHKLTTDNIETVPPDLLTLTSACVKLRMTQQPPLQSSNAVEDMESLCGTLTVAIHSAWGLQQPTCVYMCVEVDGYEFYDTKAQTHSSVHSLNPHWDQELSFQVDGAQNVKVLCVSQSDRQVDTVLGKTTLRLDSKSLNKRWRRQTLQLGQVEVTLSLKYNPHPLNLPSSTAQQQPVFCVPIESVAQHEGVLVPHVVRCSVEEVERRGMDEVGIYRISGTTGEINMLKAAFNSNLREAVTRLRSAEVNAVSGVLKLYFRELPEPLIPTELFQSLATTLDIQDINSRLVSMLSLLQSCPEANRHTFLYLMHHLQRVSEKQDVNKMSLLNLATVFGPSLLRPPVAGLGHCGPAVDISQEVEVQVQVVFCYLQCNNLPEAQISVAHDTDAEDETTHM